MEEVTICAVCQHAVDLLTTEAGGSWIHAAQDPDDHTVIPVTPGTEWRGRCDFCSHPRAEYVLPARDFPVPGAENRAMSRGAWAACNVCAPLIEGNRWNELHRRAVTIFAVELLGWQFTELTEGELRRGAGVPAIERYSKSIDALYRRLRKNITGAMRRIDEGES